MGEGIYDIETLSFGNGIAYLMCGSNACNENKQSLTHSLRLEFIFWQKGMLLKEFANIIDSYVCAQAGRLVGIKGV